MNELPNNHHKNPDDSTINTELADELNLADEDDSLILAEEEEESIATTIATPSLTEVGTSLFINPTTKTWKIMIADDEQEIHEVTQLALQGFAFRRKPLTFLSAYSGQEAKELLIKHPDIALILLDVVMESNDSGLQVVKYIRETLKNNLVRIILRTGQPGEAPEEAVIVDYDINDYKLKTELTQRRLFVTMVAGLRAYYDLMTIEINKRFSKRILETIPVGVTVYNPDKTLHYANKRAMELLGAGIAASDTSEELAEIYQFYLAGTDLHYPNERVPVTLALQGHTISADDLEIHQPTKIIPVETWSTPVYDEHNHIIQAIVAFQDITERRLVEMNKIRLAQEKEAKNAALRYSQEIEAKNAELIKLNQEKNEFLSIAAHDLKNPLSAIIGLADMITADLDSLTREEIIDYTKGITLSAKQMFDLIINLLDVNRIESGQLHPELRPTDILPVLQQVLWNYQDQAQAKNLTLHFGSSSVEHIAVADSNIVYQILDNLVSNAVKYSPLGKNINVRLTQTDQLVRFEIEDEGPGFTEDDKRKLFCKFARLTAQPTAGEHSTGLGLFIVKKLVSILNGQVWCTSEWENGATFTVEFFKELPTT